MSKKEKHHNTAKTWAMMPVEFAGHIFYSARQAIRTHATGGNILIWATLAALIIANIPAINGHYFAFWDYEMRVQIGDFNIFNHDDRAMTVLEFINDTLMAIFFFSIGLEIKREILVGELSSFRKALLPIVAAIGGMIAPVAVFYYLGQGSDYLGGAAIPMATDIAFSLGVLAMLGRRVPLSLKIFLTTLAVVDDIGGIIVIATCYATHIEPLYLLYAAAGLVLLLCGSAMAIKSKTFYLAIGGVVWYLFLHSGIHATIAGVLVAFCVPATPVFASKKYIKSIRSAIAHFPIENDEALSRRNILSREQMDWIKEIQSASTKVISPLQDLEDTLHPIVNYYILPLFAFANAGIYLLDLDPVTAFEGISLAVICGLVIGKFLGIFTFSWLAVKLKLAPMPALSNWKNMAGIAMLGGIGFTVSLFIANLTFGAGGEHAQYLLNHAKLGIVIGSLLSGILGFAYLHFTLPKGVAPDVADD